ncbi:carboxypeptidase-like regulatory domain-containing protein [Mucilaginibacter panaciglaebae]|uniref:Carboxypeptidase-like protein n=1 Tax=Mucilaginibacter panaciglaebae TaxID=502331 RepID=A0ABP7WQI9_9SPHI
MSAKRNDISQITNYLKGKLDARAMHEIERAAQDDPFLMDAFEGYEAAGNDIPRDIDDLKQRLDKRVTPRKRRKLLLWRVIPIAASLLLTIGAGLWVIISKPEKPQLAHVASNTPPQTNRPVAILRHTPVRLSKSASLKKQKSPKPLSQADSARYMIDTVVNYNATAFNVKKNTTVTDMLKKMSTMTIDSNGRIAKNNNQFYGARVNGKEFGGGSVQQAIKNLPADIIGKIQIVDDYSDQAPKKPQDVKLNPGMPAFSETMARGYIKQKSDPIKTTPFRIYGAEVRDNPVGNVEELLQGKVANLNIQNNTGAPGLRGSVNIRGLSPAPGTDTILKPVPDRVIRGYVYRDRKIANGQSYIITGKEVPDNPVGNVDQLRQGKVARLNIKNNAQSGNNTVMITGKITDTSGTPVSGVFVVNQHKIVAQSDAKGAYRAVVNADSALQVVSQGFNAQNLRVKPGQTTLDISLIDAPRLLAEVNIRGYVKRTRDQTTGSSYIITGKAGVCKENLKFKNKFLAKMAIVERYTFEHAGGYVPTVRDGRFLRALKFIAKRTKSTIKPEKGFADLKLFAQNKANWLYWYNANKCNNLK